MKFLHLVAFIGFAGSLVQANAIPQPGGDDSSLEARDDHDHHAGHHHESGLTEGVESRDMGNYGGPGEHYHINARDGGARLQARGVVRPKKRPGKGKKPVGGPRKGVVTKPNPVKKHPLKPKNPGKVTKPTKKPNQKPQVGPTAKKATISSAAVAKKQLAALTVRLANAPIPGGFSRSKFPHWQKERGCNARETVLKRDAKTFVKPTVACKLTTGSWYSAYDGVTKKSAAQMQIDHVVPLKNAWDSGAHAWASDLVRKKFANDYNGLELLSVTNEVNNKKSDKIPGEWWPPLKAYRCSFAIRWVNIKSAYKLSVLQTEKDDLEAELNKCP